VSDRTVSPAPWDLRVEHLDEPFGIGTHRPRLSWKLPRGAAVQAAYRLQVGSWDSGRIESPDSALVPYGGAPLQSRERLEWQAKVWTDAGESPWSAPGAFELGLLAPRDWQAEWIEPVEGDLAPPGRRAASLLRTTFRCDVAPRERARIYATAHGIYELFLNGRRVGDLELTPGFTSYTTRLQVQTYDIGASLQVGDNELAAVVSDGWWRGQVGNGRRHDVWGSTLALLAQVEVDGMVVATTNREWNSASAAIVAADLIEGQHTDLRRREDDPDLAWTPVRRADHGVTNLVASPAPPIRRVETIRARRVTRLGPSRHVVDLGQNINGWLQLASLGPRDTTLTITHGEALDANGDVTVEHLRPLDNTRAGAHLSAGQVDVIDCDGRADSFEPRHTVHGFQYARVEGHAHKLGADDVRGVVVHTDLRRTGWFECSDARVNRLHEAAVWSFRDNACDIPTDCPQRERMGWTGDWQLFAPTAAFLYDVAGFSTKWLRDLAADQRADGAVRNFAPNPAPCDAAADTLATYLEGSAGWIDAAVLVPWSMWRCYGDRRLLEEQWPSMVATVEYEARTARAQRHANRVERCATPAPHEQYLWDTGFHWGEWTEPDGDFVAFLAGEPGLIATAYFGRSAAILGKVARVLGRDDDAARYEDLARHVVDAWRVEYLDGDGNVRSDRQAAHVRALAFGLVPDARRAQTAQRLVALIRAKGTHLDTGFLATPYLLPVLADHGHLDVAYELLFQDTAPSWLAMIDRGATTIWENWDGNDGGDGSLNHYSKGAVISFLHDHVAGIQLLDDGPAYRRFRIAPRPGGGLTWAAAAHESPYGRIEASWSIAGDDLRVVVRVPPGTTADVALPDGQRATVTPGTATFKCRRGAR
jgi:alpha-L-rhamnosidase